MNTRAAKRYFPLLDPARFLAALWVMNYHYLFAQDTDGALSWYRYGSLGVPIFFVISGFVIVVSARGKSLADFASNRFLRLFPLFWLLCTITFVLMRIAPDPSLHVSLTDYLRSMTMLSPIFDGMWGHSTLVDTSYWTLTVELLFYALVGAYIALFGHRKLRYLFAFMLAHSMLAFAVGAQGTLFATLLCARYASYFAFGGLLAIIASKSGTHIRMWLLDITLLMSAAVYAIAIAPRALSGYAVPHALDVPIIAAIHVAFLGGITLAVALSRFISSTRAIAILAIIGSLTYPLYLLHQRVGNIMIAFVMHHAHFSWALVVVGVEVLMLFLALYLTQIDTRFRRTLMRRM